MECWPYIGTSKLLWFFLGCYLLLHSEAKQYNFGDQVVVYVNKVGPYANTYETYHFYSLPLCRPHKIIHKSLSLGQVLKGDRMAESNFKISFEKNVNRASLCGVYSLQESDVTQLVNAVEEQFYFELIVDDFRLQNFIGFVDEMETFPHRHRLFIYRHVLFSFEYNKKTKEIISASLDVDPSSAVDLAKLDRKQFEIFYSVKWTTTEQQVRDIGEKFFNSRSVQVQWISVLNSAFLVVLLIFSVTLILLSVVKHDLNRYNETGSDTDMIVLENGWKTVSMDVFRKPVNSSLFSAIIGVGTQFIFLIAIVLIIGSTKILNVHRHDSLNAVVVVLYAFTSVIAGFTSARIYRQLDGDNWISNVMLTTGLFNAPMFVVWGISNSVFWASGSTQALPYTTVALLAILWVAVGFPLTVVGAAVGKNVTAKYSAPCRTRSFPRELPILPFYHSTFCFAFLGGLIGFSSICVELNFVFSTVWGHQSYTLCHILFIVLCLLVAVVAASSMTLTYFQLNAEDYRWWWRSIFVGGSVGFFIFFYGIFFYKYRSDMSGLQQTVQYFCCLSVLCYVFFLSMGSIAFFASHRFVRFIYSSVKTD